MSQMNAGLLSYENTPGEQELRYSVGVKSQVVVQGACVASDPSAGDQVTNVRKEYIKRVQSRLTLDGTGVVLYPVCRLRSVGIPGGRES